MMSIAIASDYAIDFLTVNTFFRNTMEALSDFILRPSLSAVPAHSRSMDSSATASKREQVPTGPRSYSADLTKPDPLVNFKKKEEMAVVCDRKWKQRYFEKVRDDYLPLRAQWDAPALASIQRRGH